MIQEPSRWAVHVVDSLPLFVSSRVALLGDAVRIKHFGFGGFR